MKESDYKEKCSLCGITFKINQDLYFLEIDHRNVKVSEKSRLMFYPQLYKTTRQLCSSCMMPILDRLQVEI